VSEHDDDGLDPQARALLDAFRADEELPAVVRERIWQRLEGGRFAAGRVAVIVFAAAAAIALVLLGREALESRAQPLPVREQAPYVERSGDGGETAAVHDIAPAPRTGTSVPTPSPGESAPAPVGASPPMQPERKPVKPRTTPPAAAPSASAPVEADDPLAAEAELLRRARAALSRGEARGALGLLDEAARRFDPGVLGEEREALQVLALCDAGERAKARQRAAAFLRAHPGSPLADRVDAACASP
jgi:hypothetical protein